MASRTTSARAARTRGDQPASQCLRILRQPLSCSVRVRRRDEAEAPKAVDVLLTLNHEGRLGGIGCQQLAQTVEGPAVRLGRSRPSCRSRRAGAAGTPCWACGRPGTGGRRSRPGSRTRRSHRLSAGNATRERGQRDPDRPSREASHPAKRRTTADLGGAGTPPQRRRHDCCSCCRSSCWRPA
jgi:hypothetical protein